VPGAGLSVIGGAALAPHDQRWRSSRAQRVVAAQRRVSWRPGRAASAGAIAQQSALTVLAAAGKKSLRGEAAY